MTTTAAGDARAADDATGASCSVGRRRHVTALCLAIGLGGITTAVAAILFFPIDPRIAIGDGREAPPLLGVVLWVAVCLLTTARGSAQPGYVIIVLAFGPLIASAALGGPAAAAILALVGTTEIRELRREIPWYGSLANHGMVAFAWTTAGLVMVSLRGSPSSDATPLWAFVAIIAGTLVGLVINTAIAVLLVCVRTGKRPREAFSVTIGNFGGIVAAEVVLAWLISTVWSIAWWSAILFIVANRVVAGSLDRHRSARMVRHHPLTDLPNGLGLQEHSQRQRRPAPSGTCVFYVDLDGFKRVNDNHTHRAGDEVLRVTGRRLAAACRPTDFLAHLHGDEFVVIAYGISGEGEADDVARRLVESVEAPIAYGNVELRVSASIGWRLVADAASLDEAVQDADRHMASAKKAKAVVAGLARRGA